MMKKNHVHSTGFSRHCMPVNHTRTHSIKAGMAFEEQLANIKLCQLSRNHEQNHSKCRSRCRLECDVSCKSYFSICNKAGKIPYLHKGNILLAAMRGTHDINKSSELRQPNSRQLTFLLYLYSYIVIFTKAVEFIFII